MQLMMVAIIIGYIAYDFRESWSWVSYTILFTSGLSVILLFKRQINNMIMVRILSGFKASYYNTVKINYLLMICSNIVILTLTGLHFYLYFHGKRAMEPLYNEYGIGALLGIGMWLFNTRNYDVFITDRGIAIGGKFDQRLILWENLLIEQKRGEYILKVKNSPSLRQIKLPINNSTQIIQQLLSAK